MYIHSIYQLYLVIGICMNTTILIKRKTRNELRDIGSKGQTYDQLITELIRLKKNAANLPKPNINDPSHHN
jgi:hypothetical protein